MNNNYYYNYNNGAWMLKSAAHAEMVKTAGYNVQLYKQAAEKKTIDEMLEVNSRVSPGMSGLAGALGGGMVGAIGGPIPALAGAALGGGIGLAFGPEIQRAQDRYYANKMLENYLEAGGDPINVNKDIFAAAARPKANYGKAIGLGALGGALGGGLGGALAFKDTGAGAIGGGLAGLAIGALTGGIGEAGERDQKMDIYRRIMSNMS